ncbi:hypothetical protein AM501_18690 [Aneurinibacillus migulanus]|uniref:Uncharacterized protein YtpQ, UPF0354 family n=1 Tax=Aneurinibacillus migulanus TaxID=47500 RepID=A0A0M0H7U9_ANEMI|nr:DUF1444 family protein [Aneurinibacillus migulanus]KON98158.1 hypothetical protein AF333_24675 [Aneurinibacillus migulanus]KPD06667.1 hypothetical protein AM501_18690 [Aneurinibacillus migulanus]MCP1354347.1 DUF1444 family protein [Aneurinibacillus migulanus]MED0891442.1 DUF1444 family protein [Aneurinibacillus migulanus]MED1613869.1 DUF1444 family protein [Aneurinibacillus migulanus]
MEENKQDELRKETHHKVIERLQRSLPEGWHAESEEGKENTIVLFHGQQRDGGIHVKLDPLFAKVEQHESDKEQWIEEFVEKVILIAHEATQNHTVRGSETKLYPVLRHPSFIKENHRNMVWREHTAETIVLYALDLESSYTLITRDMLKEAELTEDELHEAALNNLARLESTPKRDKVGDNVFYFFTEPDSYSASRALNQDLLSWMRQKINGKMGIALPHQDVLIVADLADAKGAYMLAQIAVDFSMRGNIPISPIPFMYTEDGLEPYMVMRNPKSRHKYPSHGGRKKRPPER